MRKLEPEAPLQERPSTEPELHRVSASEALRALATRPSGLTASEAEERLRRDGPNALRPPPKPHLLRALFAQFVHAFALILWLAAALSFLAEWRDPGAGMGLLGVAIVCVIVLNGVFSFLQEVRAERALLSLERLLPNRTAVLREGSLEEVDAEHLVVGDLVVLHAGDRVPADGRLIDAEELRVNLAALTGESVPEARDADVAEAERWSRASNVLLAGSFVVAGRGTLAVAVTGPRTEFGRIATLSESARTATSPLHREIAVIARRIGAVACALGVVFFALGHLLRLGFWDRALFAIGVIVANVPEGLVPTVTLALAMASQRMAHRQALIRDLAAVDALGAATVICTDKTGTLTLNQMEVRRLYLGGRERTVDVHALSAAVQPHRPFFEAALACNELELVERRGRSEARGDPMDLALAEVGRAALGAFEWKRLALRPFDSKRLRVSTVDEVEGRSTLHVKGALEALLPLCDSVREEDGIRPLDPATREQIHAAQDSLASRGFRVLAFADRALPAGSTELDEALECGLTFAGLAALEDPPRAEVPEAIARCRSAGIRVIMLTGDHPRTAEAIAREIGLVRSEAPRVLTGDQVEALDDEALAEVLRSPELLFARADPATKLRVVRALERQGEIVAVTGDGVNDAPALREAHVGVAMGRGGTDVARSAAGVVLLDDNFATIVNAIEEGRAVYRNVRKFLTYILTSNVPELVPYLAFVIARVPLALTILQMLAVDLGTDIFPALALGAEPPQPGVMQRPPRRGRLLDLKLILRAYPWLGGLEAVGAMLGFFAALHRGGWHGGALLPADPLYRMATSATLLTIVFMQVGNALVCRSETSPTFRLPFGRNPLLPFAIAIELGLVSVIVYTPVGQWLFRTERVPLAAWILGLLLAAGLVLLEELRKVAASRWRVRKRG